MSKEWKEEKTSRDIKGAENVNREPIRNRFVGPVEYLHALSPLTRTTLTSILLNINVATIKTKWERYLENRKEQTNNQDSNLLLTLFILELRIN